ncbi:hypothetical protein [Empedobacter sedimenti]|uniref:hypothetical protein n=1 Tax=Empedobacter sedimenti TaxID=3042610 RepID=UPI0024A71628|nr:hypothetical protein [Empedobacter sedimenti]
MRYNILCILFFILISCHNNNDKLIELKEKELSLKERELKLKEKELSQNSDTINSNKSFDTVNDSKPIVVKDYSPEKKFMDWENILKSRGNFDYVSEKDCKNKKRMFQLYENDKYPMHTVSKNIIDFNYNNDNIKDYVINYMLENCVEGNGWNSDFIFITSENNELIINEKLTNKLKTAYFNYVSKNFGTDSYVYKKDNFIVTKSLKINMISNQEAYGEFNLLRDGSSCCPQISGNFIFNLKTFAFSTHNMTKNEY